MPINKNSKHLNEVVIDVPREKRVVPAVELKTWFSISDLRNSSLNIVRISLIIIATALILLTAIAFLNPSPRPSSPKSVPFDYNLTVVVPVSNVRQGAEMHAYIAATYIQGNP